VASALGMMGGTFDPIHCGHLAAAEEARARFQLDRVVFVPSGQPPHKKEYPVTAAECRYDMVRLAVGSHPDFEVSRVEVDRPGPSYAVDTVRTLRAQLDPETRLYFITGADAILEMLTWRSPEELAKSCDFIAVTRPGYDLGRLEQALGVLPGARVHLLNAPGVDISSTDIRQRVRRGDSLRYLVPTPVVRYIAAHGLYLH